MIIMVNTLLPLSEIREIAQRFVKIPPLPDCIISKKVYVCNEEGKGLKFTSIYDIEEGEFEEAYKYVFGFMMSYHDVPGFTFSIDVCYEASEALEVFGEQLGVKK